MSLTKDLLEHPGDLPVPSKYTAINGLFYLGSGAIMMVWPDAIQTIFRDAPFIGNEAALIRILGMTVAVIGWLYLFGSLSGDRRIVAASVLDRVRACSIGARTLSRRRSFSSLSAHVCGSRPDARHRRLAPSELIKPA